MRAGPCVYVYRLCTPTPTPQNTDDGAGGGGGDKKQPSGSASKKRPAASSSNKGGEREGGVLVVENLGALPPLTLATVDAQGNLTGPGRGDKCVVMWFGVWFMYICVGGGGMRACVVWLWARPPALLTLYTHAHTQNKTKQNKPNRWTIVPHGEGIEDAAAAGSHKVGSDGTCTLATLKVGQFFGRILVCDICVWVWMDGTRSDGPLGGICPPTTSHTHKHNKHRRRCPSRASSPPPALRASPPR